MNQQKEQSLIEQLKSKDEIAFKKLYHLYYQQCKHWIEKHFDCNSEHIEDVYQDAMIALYEAAIDGKLDKISCSIKTYLFAICRNQMLRQFKLQKRSDDHVDDIKIVQREWLEPEQEESENVIKVKTMISSTDEPCKSILTLFYYDGKSISEIAKALDYPNKNVVKVQKSRCLNYLKSKLWKTQS